MGTEIKVNPNFNLWGNVSHQWGGSGYRDTKITIGLKYSF
ncbi:autotransporter outer membrane beta-barrel domain-containing protein [Fusobacterium varium]